MLQYVLNNEETKITTSYMFQYISKYDDTTWSEFEGRPAHQFIIYFTIRWSLPLYRFTNKNNMGENALFSNINAEKRIF